MDADQSPIAARKESMYDAFAKASERSTPYEPSKSPLFGMVGFVVGAPRSGTTWLQQLLFTHPLITTAGESHMFCELLGPAFENFRRTGGIENLNTWVDEGELLTIARAFSDSIFLAQRAGARPEAKLVLEKTPNHRLQSELQAKLYPDAHYVHIIRDGRDSTASQRKNWGRAVDEFADPEQVAAAWAAEVRDIRRHLGPLSYLELRYEDVVADTPGSLARIFDHFGLPHDAAMCQAAAEFGKAPVHTYPDSSEIGIRKHKGDALSERSVARAAGDLLVELGYADAAEIEKLRHLRTSETMAADARLLPARALRTARTRGTHAWERWRTRGDRRAREEGRRVSHNFIVAVEAGDTAALAALLSPTVEVNGAKAASPAAAAEEVMGKLGGSHCPRRGVSGGVALNTFVTDDGDRIVVRVKPRDGRVSEIEFV